MQSALSQSIILIDPTLGVVYFRVTFYWEIGAAAAQSSRKKETGVMAGDDGEGGRMGERMGSSWNSDQRSGRRRVVTTRCELLPPSASIVPPPCLAANLLHSVFSQRLNSSNSRPKRRWNHPAARHSTANFSSSTSLSSRRSSWYRQEFDNIRKCGSDRSPPR